jgi:hypothetical protein
MLVSQSYNIFNRFGKDSTAIADITRAFIEDLQPYTIEQITKAFKQWRQTESGMPVPANIQDLIKNARYEGKGKKIKFQQFEGTWQQYLAFLDENGHLSPNIVQENGKYGLREGYEPEWTLKDFTGKG